MKKLALLIGLCSILIFTGIASADTLVKTTETNFGDGILYTGEPTIYLINDTAARVLYQWDISDGTYEYPINSTDYYINDNTYSNNGAIYEPSNYQLNNLGGGMFNLSSTYYFLFAKWLVGTWTGNLKLCNSTDGKTTATENCKDVSTIADQTGFFMADFYIPNDNEAWIYYVENPSANNWTFKRRIYYRGNDTFGDEDTLFYEGFDITRALRIREFNSTFYIYYSHYINSLYVRNSTDGLNFNDSQTIVSAISYGEFVHQIFYLQGKYHLVMQAGDNVELFTSDYPDNSFSYQRILIYNVRSPFSVAVSGTKFIIATSNQTGGYPYNKNIYMSQWEYVPFVLNFVPPTPDSGSYTNQLDFTVNVSADTSLSDCWLDFQGMNFTMTVNGDYCYFTKSLSVNNCFSYKVYANSTASDLVVTPTRGICQDNSPPLVTIISPQNITYNTTNISLEVSANDTIDTWWYSLNGGANTTFSPNTTITGTEGSNEIIVYANDTAGNTGSDTEYFTITIPSLNITWNTPINNSFTLNLSSILWNATLGNTPNTCILNINGTINYTMLISGNDCYYTTSSLTNQTTYCGIIYANNSIYNISSMRCATINLTSEVTPPTPPRPIDNMGLFGGVALLVMGAGVLLFLMDLLFSKEFDLKMIITGIIGAIIIIAIISVLL